MNNQRKGKYLHQEGQSKNWEQISLWSEEESSIWERDFEIGDRDKLEIMLVLCRYTSALVELERGMKMIFGMLQTKFTMQKLKAFTTIKKHNKTKIPKFYKKIITIISKKLHKFSTLLQTKILNNKSTSFLVIKEHWLAEQSKKSKNIKNDEDLKIENENNRKRKEVEELERKYIRLLEEMAVFNRFVRGLGDL